MAANDREAFEGGGEWENGRRQTEGGHDAKLRADGLKIRITEIKTREGKNNFAIGSFSGVTALFRRFCFAVVSRFRKNFISHAPRKVVFFFQS